MAESPQQPTWAFSPDARKYVSAASPITPATPLEASRRFHDAVMSPVTPIGLNEAADASTSSEARDAVDDLDDSTLEAAEIREHKFLVPMARNPNFHGREGALSSLRRALTVADPDSGRITDKILVCGESGCGKTSTVVEYAYRFQPYYRTVMYIHANDNRRSLHLALEAFSEDLHVRRHLDDVCEWLRTNGHWLLIIDDCSDMEMLKSLLPEKPHDESVVHPGHVIVTCKESPMTQYTSQPYIVEEIHLKGLSSDFALEYLLSQTGRTAKPTQAGDADTDAEIPLSEVEMQAALRLVRSVRQHPLALEMMAHTIAAGEMEFPAYEAALLARIDDVRTLTSARRHHPTAGISSPSSLMSPRARSARSSIERKPSLVSESMLLEVANIPEATHAAFLVAWSNALEIGCAGDLALRDDVIYLFTLAALFDGRTVDMELLTRAPLFDDSLSLSLSLSRRLLACFSRAAHSLSRVERAANLLESFGLLRINRCAASLSVHEAVQVMALTMLAEGKEGTDSVFDSLDDALSTLASLSPPASPSLSLSLSLSTFWLHASKLTTYAQHSCIYSPAAAEVSARQARVLVAKLGRGRERERERERERDRLEGVELLDRALAMRRSQWERVVRRRLGRRERERALEEMANAVEELGDVLRWTATNPTELEKAETLYAESLSLRQSLSDPARSNALISLSLHRQALLSLSAGDYETALKRLQKAAVHHRRVADVHCDMARVYLLLRDQEAAKAHITQALTAYTREKDRGAYLRARVVLSTLLEPQEALRILVEVLGERRERCGGEKYDPTMADIYRHLGRCYYTLQRLPEARQALTKALHVCRKCSERRVHWDRQADVLVIGAGESVDIAATLRHLSTGLTPVWNFIGPSLSLSLRSAIDTDLLGDILHYLSACYLAAGELESARELMREHATPRREREREREMPCVHVSVDVVLEDEEMGPQRERERERERGKVRPPPLSIYIPKPEARALML